MKPEPKKLFCRLSLALLTLLSGAPSLGATPDLVKPPGDGRKAGNDGVGGIEKGPPASGNPGPKSGGGASGPILPSAANGSDPWADLGEALAGSSGLPELTGDGAGSAGTLVSFDLRGGVPGGSATLVVGTASVGVPFKGGTLVPNPSLMLAGLPLNSQGACHLPVMLPAALPAGFTIYAQAWIADPGAVLGFCSTNGLSLTVQ